MPVQTALVGAGGAVKSIFVVLSSMAPFVENKGSILLAAALNVKWYLAYIGTSIEMCIRDSNSCPRCGAARSRPPGT